jgi:hypothetical protein
MKIKIYNFFKIIFWAGLILLPSWALALTNSTVKPLDRCQKFANQFEGVFSAVPPGYCTASGVLVMAINILLSLAGTAAILFLIIGGFWFLTAAGNEETSEKGRKTMVNAVIGLIVILLSAAIVRIITSTLAL